MTNFCLQFHLTVCDSGWEEAYDSMHIYMIPTQIVSLPSEACIVSGFAL